MFHLAPVGLEPPRRVSRDRHHVYQTQIVAAIQKFVNAPSDAVFTSKDAETRDLLKCLDSFFCHGFLIPPKCYWVCVREFLPQSERKSMALEWNTRSERTLSLAWLKNALNQQSLHFQMLALIRQPALVAKYYDSNACIRNLPVFKKIAVATADLNLIAFQIETASMKQQSDIPVAQLTSTTPVVHVASSSTIETRSFSKKRQMNNEIILSASFQPNEYLARFPAGESVGADVNEDLPHVEVPATANEPFLPTARDQEFMLDELVKSHRARADQQRAPFSSTDSDGDERAGGFGGSKAKRSPPTARQSSSNGSFGNPFGTVEEDGAKEEPKSRSPRQRRKSRRDRKAVASSLSCSTTSTDDENERRKRTPPTALREIEERGLDLSKPIVSLRDELRGTASPAVATGLDGDIALSAGEVIQMAINVFRDDVENFQRLFAVYVDHAVGQPKRRFLCLTDRYLYVLSSTVATSTGRPIPQLSRAAELSYLSSSMPIGSAPPMAAFSPSPVAHLSVAEESRRRTTSMAVTGTHAAADTSGGSRGELAPADSSNITDEDADGLDAADTSLQISYHVETAVPLDEIEGVTLGVDGQSVAVQTRNRCVFRRAVTTTEHEQKQFVVETGSQQLGECIAVALQRAVKWFGREHTTIAIGSGLTMYSIILRNFSAAPDTIGAGNTLESYLYMRNFYPKAWRRKADKWAQAYFVLRGQMLYQFTDSTCKVAENSVNIRERVDEITPVDLRDDEQFVFELHFNDGTPNMQLSFAARDQMYQWMTSITMVFSTAVEDSLVPVGCALILTDTSVLFAQEGANCLVDGFMRLLLQLTVRDFASLAALRTPRHNVLILRRESGASELVFLRNEAELQRLCTSFGAAWGLHVDELSEAAAQSDLAYARAYRQCLQMSDVWSAPADPSGYLD
ncbi:Pleckstrin-like proteiny domain-containing family M member 2 [Aphelenchoides fujianensis]|nr:Pleckstrin-like proteiny domain-containing family M member 2 [Aphelenchoides fujianensis]